MRFPSRFLPVLAVLSIVSACSEAGLPLAPEVNTAPELTTTPLGAALRVGESATVSTDINVSPLQCGENGEVTITLEGTAPPPEKAPVDVMLVVDQGSYVSDADWASVVAADQAFVQAMDLADGTADQKLSTVRIGVVDYAKNSFVRGLGYDYVNIYATVSRRYFYGGKTNTPGALVKARDHLLTAARPGAATAVVLVTAGYSDFPGTEDVANSIRDAGASLFVVGVGESPNTELLEAIAGPGRYFAAADYTEMLVAFNATAGEITFPAAVDVAFSATVPEGFELVAGSATSAKGSVTADGNTLTWTVGQLDDESVTMTYSIRHDPLAAPAGGLMTAVSNASTSATSPTTGQVFVENHADVTAEVPVCDTTPPDISYVLDGPEGAHEWFIGDVTLTWTVTDGESPVMATEGCDAVSVTQDGEDYAFTCSATSAGGQSQMTAAFRLDGTVPTVAYSGIQPSYDIGELIDIECSAGDNLSGLDEAGTSCEDVSAGAWEFPLGLNTLDASATDMAGNGADAEGSFTVTVSYDGMCSLVESWVSQSGIANALCAKLEAAAAAESRGQLNARDGSLNAFIQQVKAQAGKKIPADKAPVLISLAEGLMT